MTVSQAIIKWLKTFNPTDYWKMKSIDTDMQRATVATYSLVKEPVTSVKHYMSGKKEYTDHYQMQARLSSQTNPDRIDNGAWLEAITEWISEQNRYGNYPVLDTGEVKQIGVTTPFYMGQANKETAIYQLTIAIKYVKEN